MAKGNQAKEAVIAKIQSAFGSDFIGIDDKKKLYVWADDGGERVQIAMALTCPKTNVDFGNAPLAVQSDNTMNFDTPVEAPKMGEDEQATLDRLMQELGL